MPVNRSDRRRITRELQKNKGRDLTREQVNSPETRAVWDSGYNAGVNAGMDQGIEHSYKSCYAAAVLTAKRMFQLDEEKAIEFLGEMDGIIHQSLASDELTRMVYKEIGIQIDFGNGIEPYKEEDILYDYQ